MTRHTTKHHFRKRLSAALAISGLVTALFAVPALADDAADVTRLMRAGQYAEALARADAFLGRNPRDAQMRFLKGVILTEQNKTAEAIAIFTRLTEDYPGLPEPYNNLAVLYAASGQYEKARQALDAAIRTNPTYATAYENLGDVHAKLASQAYDRALQLDSGNSTAKSKLTMVRTLVSNMGAAAPAARPASPPAPVAVARPADPMPPQAVAKPPVATPPVNTPPVVAAAPPPAKPAVEERQAARSEPKPEPRPAKSEPKVHPEQDRVLAVVNGWAKAWSDQDVRSYLAHYASDFRTPGGVSRKTWEEERRARISGKGRISVEVESPRVSFDDEEARVSFRQIYISDRLTATTRKTLTLIKRGGKWQIRQEIAGS